MSNQSTIKCSNCGSEVDVNEALYNQLESKFKQDTEIEREKYKKAMLDLKAKEEAIKDAQEKFDLQVRDATQLQLKVERQRVYDEIKKRLEIEQSESNALLLRELNEKSNQVKELNKTKAEVEKLKRDNAEITDKTKANIEQEFNKKLQVEKSKQNIELQKNLAEIEALKQAQENIKKSSQLEHDKQLKTALETLRVKTEQETKIKITQETEEQLKLLKQELDEKSNQVKELNASKAEIERLKREKEEIESKAKADAEIQLIQKLKEEKEKYLKESDEKLELKLKEKDEQLEQIKRQLDETKRKAEQGSTQIQGESQEHIIESWLTSFFQFDDIEEIGKGAFGADCVQTINTRDLQNCGKICFESKNAKAWSNDWITKLKQDILKVNADIGVLVTQAMPKNMERMGFLDGIWVCSLSEFKGSASLLRDGLIKVKQATLHQENKTDKMHILYDYLTSNEFNMQFRSIVNGFMQMQEELDKEKRSLMASWKRRQKNIDMVLANTTEVYGSIKGIAGNAIENVKVLELEYDDIAEDES